MSEFSPWISTSLPHVFSRYLYTHIFIFVLDFLFFFCIFLHFLKLFIDLCLLFCTVWFYIKVELFCFTFCFEFVVSLEKMQLKLRWKCEYVKMKLFVRTSLYGECSEIWSNKWWMCLTLVNGDLSVV